MNQPVRLAALAQALQGRFEALPASADPSWHPWIGLPAELDGLPPCDARRRVGVTLFRSRCGPLPPLPLVAAGAGPLALLDRQTLLSRLCALALLGRPGVLRCCVERQARLALERALGEGYVALRERSRSGPAVPGHIAGWTPLAWAWVGWRELARDGAWPHRSLRRLARLALPASRAGAPPGRLVPAAPVASLRRLTELYALYPGDPPC